MFVLQNGTYAVSWKLKLTAGEWGEAEMADDITFLIQTIKEIASLTRYEEISPL